MMAAEQPLIIAVCADPPDKQSLRDCALAHAESIGIEMVRPQEAKSDLLLAVTEDRHELRVLRGEADLVGGHPVFADFTTIDTTSPAGRRLDMPLLKAVGIRKGEAYRPCVIDCTAGLGEDAWLLAAHGCTVHAIERQHVIATLLADALQRAARTHDRIAHGITLHRANAIDWLTQTSGLMKMPSPPDAIVIDTMFPTGRRAKERKPMRVLRMLAGDDADAPALLDAALRTKAHRVCVKRPLHAPPIEHPVRTRPDVVYKGKAVRFDVYINN